MANEFLDKLKIGGLVGAASAAISMLYNYAAPTGGVATVSFSLLDINVKQQVQQGLATQTGTLGGKLMAYLSGVVPTVPALQVFVTAGVIGALTYLAGSYAYDFAVSKAFTPSSKLGRFTTKMVTGTALLAVVPAFTIVYPTVAGSLGYFSYLLTLGFYFALVGLAVGFAGKFVPQLKDTVE